MNPKPITITIYNSTCLYEPDNLKLIKHFPIWSYLYRNFITIESKNTLKTLEKEQKELLQNIDHIRRGIHNFRDAQSGWIQLKKELELKLQREGLINYIYNNPIKSYDNWEVYKKTLEKMNLKDLEKEANKNKYEAVLMVEDIMSKMGFIYFKNKEYNYIYSQIFLLLEIICH